VLCEDDGITAELWLGALVDAGAPADRIQAALDASGAAARLVAERCDAREVTATRIRLETDASAPRVDTVAVLQERITAAGLGERAHDRVRAVADALAGSEATVHGVAPEAVRFHELGRPHTVARLIAGAVALELLEIDEVTCSPVALGSGVLHIAHGRFPVPPPAVLALLHGFTVQGGSRTGELTTPSGAAVLAGLARPSDAIPMMRLERHGRGVIGSGDRERLLTVMIGTAS